MSKDQRQIEGFFLSFEHEEFLDIQEELRHNGYSPDGDGLKELLLDVLYGEGMRREDGFLEKTQRYIRNNPDKVRAGINLATGLLKMMRGTKR